MTLHKSSFLKALSKEVPTEIPLYCTGYPEVEFIEKYIKKFNLKFNRKTLILNSKNYNIIKQMGFNAISLWDFRRGEGGYLLKDQK
jgi:hypothetical protein